MSEKLKILTKIESFEDVQKSLQAVEKSVNALIDSVNKPAESEKKETEGKTGDIKSTSEGTNRGADYNLEIKTEGGWKTPISKPHYESKWTSMVLDTSYKFKHNLGTKFLLVQLYFKTENGAIWNLSNTNMQEVYNVPTNMDTGYCLLMQNDNTLEIGTGIFHLFIHQSTSEGNSAAVDSGHMKVLAWKTGVK